MVLYDAASPAEKRPFPKHIHFTAGFDTGQQGKHWRGDFEIVPEKGYFWRAARSVVNRDTGAPWIRLHLRGERPLGEVTQLSFRYHVTGADGLRVRLLGPTGKVIHTADLKSLKKDEWAQATADFGT